MTIRRVIGALAALLAAAAVTASAGEGPRALKIGVVDVDKVLREYKKSDDLYKKLGEDFKPLDEALKKKGEMIRAEQRRLADSDRDANSLELFKDRQALDLKVAEFRTEEKKLLLEKNAAKLRAMNEVWGDMLKAVEKYAKDKGLDLVVKQQLRTDDARTDEAFYRNVAAATLLYYGEHLDCTDDVVKALNAAYERGGSAAPAKGGK